MAMRYNDFMKTKYLTTVLAVAVIGVLALPASIAMAQDSSSPAAVNVTSPQLAYGVPQILQLTQAKVGDDTIIAYIKNSGTSYGLNADQIIYLKQQGVSDAVITTMLNQPKAGVAAYAPTTPAPQSVAQTAVATVPTTTVAPTVTYVQAAPAPVYYYAQPYYYPSYAWYPPVSLSFAWAAAGMVVVITAVGMAAVTVAGTAAVAGITDIIKACDVAACASSFDCNIATTARLPEMTQRQVLELRRQHHPIRQQNTLKK